MVSDHFCLYKRYALKVVAIIVTHNRSEKLKVCLERLFSASTSPDEVVVINNASTDDTKQVLHDYSPRYTQLYPVHLEENLGGAGGFEHGMKVAFDRNADLFWLMDDDCYVEPLALHNLIVVYETMMAYSKTTGKDVGFVCSKVNWTDGSVCEMNQPSVNWDYLSVFSPDQPVLKVIGCSFVSCMISKKAVEKVGYPIGKFFIWFDDAEYTRRISKYFDCYCALNSEVVHATQNNEGVWFGNINEYNFHKFRLGARNESWYRFYKEGFADWLYFVICRCREMREGGVGWRYRIKMFWYFVQGVYAQFVR